MKNLPAMWETSFNPWFGKIPLEKEMATHSSILAWKIPEVEEPLSSRRTAVHGVVKSQAQLSDFHT